MSILIADSGGTKTDWLYHDQLGGSEVFQTRGLNPHIIGWDEIAFCLGREVLPRLSGKRPNAIYFMGSGLGSVTGQDEMKALLNRCFNSPGTVMVQTDLFGAAYACLGDTPGVAAILGTGSVAFSYDGKTVLQRKGGRGYLLGDEGSGASMGGALLRHLLDGELSENVARIHHDFFNADPDRLLDMLYTHPTPARFLAGQISFLSKFREDPEIRAFISSQIERFLNRCLLPLLSDNQSTVAFTGGISREFSDILEHLCGMNGLHQVNILAEPPIRAMARYFLSHATID